MIKIDSNYSDYRIDTDPGYPGGKAKPASSPESIDGTPIRASWMNDINGFRQALYIKAFGSLDNVSNTPDTAQESDSMKALLKLQDESKPASALPKHVHMLEIHTGAVVETNISQPANQMIHMEILGNGNNCGIPINTIVQIFDYADPDSIQPVQLNLGYELPAVSLYHEALTGNIRFYIPKVASVQTYYVKVYAGDSPSAINRVFKFTPVTSKPVDMLSGTIIPIINGWNEKNGGFFRLNGASNDTNPSWCNFEEFVLPSTPETNLFRWYEVLGGNMANWDGGVLGYYFFSWKDQTIKQYFQLNNIDASATDVQFGYTADTTNYGETLKLWCRISGHPEISLRAIQGNYSKNPLWTQTDPEMIAARNIRSNEIPYAEAVPTMDGIAEPGFSLKVAREDHQHPSDTSRASLESPDFTGIPTAPTAEKGTNNTQIATTEFVNAAVSDEPEIPSGNGTLIKSLAAFQTAYVDIPKGWYRVVLKAGGGGGGGGGTSSNHYGGSGGAGGSIDKIFYVSRAITCKIMSGAGGGSGAAGGQGGAAGGGGGGGSVLDIPELGICFITTGGGGGNGYGGSTGGGGGSQGGGGGGNSGASVTIESESNGSSTYPGGKGGNGGSGGDSSGGSPGISGGGLGGGKGGSAGGLGTGNGGNCNSSGGNNINSTIGGGGASGGGGGRYASGSAGGNGSVELYQL